MKPVQFLINGSVIAGFPAGAGTLLNHEVRHLNNSAAVNLHDRCGGKVVSVVNTANKGTAPPLFEDRARSAGRYPVWNLHKHLMGRQGRPADDPPGWMSPQSDALIDTIGKLS